jgi:hypothetical protein
MRITILSLGLFVACGTPAEPPATPPAATTEPEAPVDHAADGDAAGGEAHDGEAHDGDAAGDEADAAAKLPDASLLDKAKGLARGMMPKDAMMSAVTPVLGDPASTSDTEAIWIARAGEGCKALKVTLMGDMVGNASVEDAECPKADGAAE